MCEQQPSGSCGQETCIAKVCGTQLNGLLIDCMACFFHFTLQNSQAQSQVNPDESEKHRFICWMMQRAASQPSITAKVWVVSCRGFQICERPVGSANEVFESQGFALYPARFIWCKIPNNILCDTRPMWHFTSGSCAVLCWCSAHLPVHQSTGEKRLSNVMILLLEEIFKTEIHSKTTINPNLTDLTLVSAHYQNATNLEPSH